ncbi:hypothetical protein ES288_A08G041600v1 [Gossypium darwinii]|uniref:Uncharacterized protein n=1 Tax=Gossypium darwinii TaxID=34276 RepID=A0A5D2FK32_GOSDA|nr:hypothetical protein ES288_A08G041600v1 [Gossypium darwinii]
MQVSRHNFLTSFEYYIQETHTTRLTLNKNMNSQAFAPTSGKHAVNQLILTCLKRHIVAATLPIADWHC